MLRATEGSNGDPRAPIRIWFNRTFSSAHHAVRLIRDNPDGRAVEIFGTHESLDAVFLGGCDNTGLEPTVPASEYVDFALDFCARNRIDVFIPKRYAETMALHRERFEAVGTRLLIAGSAAAMRAVSDKGLLYRTLDRLVPGSAPRHHVVRTATEFAAAHSALIALGSVVCFKPATGEGGGGFRVVDDSVSPLSALDGLPSERLALATVLGAMQDVRAFEPLIVSECFLDADEYSLDCLARDGELLVAVPRLKVSARVQRIVEAPQLVEIARVLVGEFELDALFNVQFMTGADGAKVIDVNPRMAAGIDVAAASGVNLPWLGVLAALGEPLDVPQPRYGVSVGRLDHLVTVRVDAA